MFAERLVTTKKNDKLGYEEIYSKRVKYRNVYVDKRFSGG